MIDIPAKTSSSPDVVLKNDLSVRYQSVRQLSVTLCQPLRPEDHVVQPVVDVSPPKWHLGHTTWFFETFVLSHFKGYRLFNEDYGYLFNSYYETVGKRVLRVNRGLMTRPSVDEVLDYREYVDYHMEAFLTSGDVRDELLPVIELGLQHEQQHQELLVYDIKYILGHQPVFPIYKEASTSDEPGEIAELNFLPIEEGIYSIGFDGDDFHFDNEEGVHSVFLHEFAIANRLVTNGEYIEFIESSGYTDFRYWLSEGWDFAKSLETKAPHYWHKIDGIWHSYTLGGLTPIDKDLPVAHVSYFEADAFARWKGLRLPTEFEWEVACKQYEHTPQPAANFVNQQRFQPVVESQPHQFMGNLWQWTSSAYQAYPYFKIAEGAIGEYNGKFMVNQMVLRGGSYATSRDHIRPTYRNFFHPQLRWLCNGIRLAKHI
ncbi:MAG: ergothioneine biosynthesis protein EgtB [Bacteroidota bacterium]